MKKRYCRISVISLLTVFLFSFVMTVSAGAEAARGLSAEIKTDKNDYVSGDRADITLTMTNGSSDTLENVSGEIVLPEDMKLISGDLTTDSYVLAAGESREHKVTAVVEGSSSSTSEVESTVSESSQADSSVNTSDTSSAASSKAADTAGGVNPSTGSRNAAPWIVLMLISAAGLIIIATKKKQGKRMLSMFLCTAMCVSAFAAEFPQTASADSAESFDGLVITKDVTVNGKKATVTAKVKGSVSQSDDDTVTISFDSGDGTPVEPVTAIKGKEAGTLPQAYQAGRSFTGWYSDKGLTEPFYADTVVNEDTTLYASYVDSDDNFQLNKPSTYYAEDQSEKLAITLISDSEITADNLFDFISLRALTGEVPDKFIVTANGNEYTFIPESSYTAGCLYRMTVNDGVTIKGVGEEVTEYTFRIYKPESNILELNNEVKYLDKDKLIATDSEFEYIASKSYYNEQSLKVGDTVCLGYGTQKIDESVRFMNIVDITEYSGEYYITLEDSDVDDVFDQVDISFKKDMTNEILSGGIDTQALEQSLYSSEGVVQLNMIMAAVLAESDEVKDELGGVSLLASNDTDKAMTDFSENARLKEDALFDLSKKLGKDLSISVTIGDAENDNFGVCDPENWCAITFTLSYNSTIKNKLKVDASITITEYLNISLQGYKSFEFHLFKESQLEFDYAINVYSQTDIGFKVLVCSTNKKNEKWRDISDDVKKMLGSNEENDTDSLVAQMQEMLSNQGDYITLCEIPMFKASQPLVPPITIFSVNLELNYVMKVNFAAGISSNLSVLDATQIGVCGDSSTGKFEGYKNKLIGADRYSFDLTACGYMGIKTGIEGSVTLSFFGLERLGKVGMALEVGAYLDLYGYAKYHVVKPEQYYDNVYRTLVGGFYMESGIYLELKLIAKSDVFKAKLELPLAEKKWPFFTMGNKEVLLSMDKPTTPIVLTSKKGEGKVKVKMEELPAMTGTVLDITTGKKKNHAVIPWGNIFMGFSHRGFTIEQVYSSKIRGFDKYVQYNKAYDPSKNTVSATAEIYYTGPYLQFTKAAAKGTNTVANVEIIWADATKINPDEIGKVYTANFYSEVDGVRELIGTRQVMAGNVAGAMYPDGIYGVKYTRGSWNKDPATTVMRNNTDFIYSRQKRQGKVAFLYYDANTNLWTAEIRAANVNEKAVPPEEADSKYMKLKEWHTSIGYNYRSDVCEATNGIKVMNQGIYERLGSQDLVYGQPVDKALYKVTSPYHYDLLMTLHIANQREYYSLTYIYTASYVVADLNVKFAYEDYKGEQHVEMYTYPYNGNINIMPWNHPLGKRLLGYSTDPSDGNIYGEDMWFPPVRDDVTYFGVYETKPCKVTLQYYDDINDKYVDYKTYTVQSGNKIPEEYFKEAEDACIWRENTEHTINYWENARSESKFDKDKKVLGDITLRVNFEQTLTLKLDPGEGKFNSDVTEIKVTSKNFFEFIPAEWAAKESDETNDYKLTGWKNPLTGDIYAVGQKAYWGIPTTLTAVYAAVPKTYNATITTEYGVLQNGKTEDTYSGGYEGYTDFVNKYLNWLPADVVEEGLTRSCKGCSKILSSDGLSITINYDSWSTTVHKHTITLDPNGGVLNGISSKTVDYGTLLDLTSMASPTKTDDMRDYILQGWKDQDGNFYNAMDENIIVRKDLDLKAVWKDGKPKEYTITYILNGNTIDTVTMHYCDTLTDYGKPDEAAGLLFSGWTWSSKNGLLSKMPKTMPAYDLTATATAEQCYVYYEVDGESISDPEPAAIGSLVTVKDKFTAEGYEVSDWTAEGVTITDGKFTMPAGNVTFKATKTPKKYKVTIYVDGKVIADSPISADYNSTITLPEQPEREGYTFYWKTADDTLIPDGEYTIPAKDTEVYGVYTEKTFKAYFYLEGEDEPFYVEENLVKGSKVQITHYPDKKEDGQTFSGWYPTDVIPRYDNTYIIEDSDIHFTGKLTTIKFCSAVIIMSTEDENGNDVQFDVWQDYGDYGETITVPDLSKDGYMLYYDCEIKGAYDNNAHTVTLPEADSGTDVVMINISYQKIDPDEPPLG